ncbi:hypothetical protein BDQ17DRAFT_1429658 [Cyathus striatus]|nr:hypothetical protein BDQ17DRAFT_1429658 [Cyathus striatus]
MPTLMASTSLIIVTHSVHSEVYEQLDNKHMARLAHFDNLDAIIPWSGWWYPNQDNIHQIHTLSHVGVQQGKSSNVQGQWFLHGEFSTFTCLHGCPASIPTPALPIAGPSHLSQHGSNNSAMVTAMDTSDDPQQLNEMDALPPDSPF